MAFPFARHHTNGLFLLGLFRKTKFDGTPVSDLNRFKTRIGVAISSITEEILGNTWNEIRFRRAFYRTKTGHMMKS